MVPSQGWRVLVIRWRRVDLAVLFALRMAIGYAGDHSGGECY